MFFGPTGFNWCFCFAQDFSKILGPKPLTRLPICFQSTIVSN